VRRENGARSLSWPRAVTSSFLTSAAASPPRRHDHDDTAAMATARDALAATARTTVRNALADHDNDGALTARGKTATRNALTGHSNDGGVQRRTRGHD
jgi:hypothetical protein